MGRARAPGVAVTSPLCREGPRLVRSRLQMARQPCEHGTHFAPQFMLLGGLCAFPLGRRQTCYPAHWAWEAEAPFSFVQCDVKDVYDKGTLGTELTTHLARLGLPRYVQAQYSSGKRSPPTRSTPSCGVGILQQESCPVPDPKVTFFCQPPILRRT